MGEHETRNKSNTSIKATTSIVVCGLLGTFACGAPSMEEDEIESQWAALGLPTGESAAAKESEPLAAAAQATVIEVDTLTKLQTMSATGNYRLTANIDASSGFTPIQFSGTLDGNGFTIQNLNINRPTESYVGLFSTLDTATIRNVRLTNVNVRGRNQVGGLAGTIFETVITDSYVEGTVTGGGSVSQGTDVGLFAGYVHGADIRRSYARGTVLGLATKVGGFIGNASHSMTQATTIKECYTRVNVNPTTTNAGWEVLAGGFIGYATGIDVSDVYALGTVRGRGPVAGLIAKIVSTTDRPVRFYNSYSRNTVTDANGPDRGSTYSMLTGTAANLSGLYWDATIDPALVHPNAGQAGISSAALKLPTSANAAPYTGWNSTVWDAGSTAQYHVLRNVVRPTAQLRE
jgi:hypothetical protein